MFPFYDPLFISRWRSLSYRNQSTDFLCKSMDWFLYDRDLCQERVKNIRKPLPNTFHINAQFLWPSDNVKKPLIFQRFQRV